MASPAPTILAPFPIAINGKEVLILNSTKTLEELLKFKPFADLVTKLNEDPLWDLRTMEIQSIDMFGPRIGFLKIKVVGHYNNSKTPVPGICFLRGDAVAILPILHCNGGRYVVCVEQPRMPDGRLKLELPAGMMDGEGNFAGTAAKEMAEETGLTMHESELQDITPPSVPKVGPSIGACDEKIKILYWTKEVTPEQLAELEGKTTGNLEEGEVIKVRIIKLEDMFKVCDDMKWWAAYGMLTASGIAF